MSKYFALWLCASGWKKYLKTFQLFWWANEEQTVLHMLIHLTNIRFLNLDRYAIFLKRYLTFNGVAALLPGICFFYNFFQNSPNLWGHPPILLLLLLLLLFCLFICSLMMRIWSLIILKTLHSLWDLRQLIAFLGLLPYSCIVQND